MAFSILGANPSVISGNLRLYRGPRQAFKSVGALSSLPRQTPAISSPSVKLLPKSKKASLAKVWQEIQGCDDWDHLINPLDPLLREEILRYGEFVLACYKAFDLDPSSKRYLNCKYGKRRMFSEVGIAGFGYEVTKYIYATPDINIPTQEAASGSRWIGYVAVSSDEEVKLLGRRDILVSFRGTVTITEWIANLMSSLEPARFDPHDPRPDVKVESGFLCVYTSDDSTCKFSHGSCREQLLSELSRILNKYKGEELSITLAGHSMGSSLALLLGYDLSELGLNRDGSNKNVPITVYSFAGPRVGNSGFKERCEELGVKVLRVVNVNDPVTMLPGVFLNENFRVLGGTYELPWSCSCYAHVGVELALDSFKMKNPMCVHDMDAYLGLLKCPNMRQVRKNSEDLLHKAWELLKRRILDACQWQNAASNLGNMIESLRICALLPWLPSR